MPRPLRDLPEGGRIDADQVRELNRRIAALTAAVPDGPVEYICECGGARCAGVMIELPQGAFQKILDTPGHYLAALGHDGKDREVVKYGRGYLIIRHTPQQAGPDG